MFEYLLYTCNSQAYFTGVDIKRPEVESAQYQKYKKCLGIITIEFLTRLPYDEFFYEDSSICLLVLGKVFRKLDQNSMIQKRLLPRDLVTIRDHELIDLRGSFIIIKIDKITEEVKIVNDLFGLKPLYYGRLGKFYVISNSLTAIKSFSPEIDEANFIEKLIFEHNLSRDTIYKNVFSLNEASILILKDSFHVKTYFSWYDYFSAASNENKFDIEKYISFFNASVRSKAENNKTNLVTLTGGHDGRAVLSSFVKQRLQVETFSYGRPGSENTRIPETIARKMGFKHTSIYLLEEFEKEYVKNAKLTAWLSDGELIFSQQTTLYAAGQLAKTFSNVFTGLLAGELVGAVHLLTDYINPVYYRYFYSDEIFNLERELKPYQAVIKISNSKEITDSILYHLADRKKKLVFIKEGGNKHLFSLCDMITWGFRKFYAYQMHLARYHLQNYPVFCDFDLMDLLINSSYNQIYRNSYKSLYHRKNSRRLQLEIIDRNSPELSSLPLDRGYSPREAIRSLYFVPRILKYLVRKNRIRKGMYTSDFLGKQWTDLIYQSNLFDNYVLTEMINYEIFKKKCFQRKNDDEELSSQDILLITHLLFGE